MAETPPLLQIRRRPPRLWPMFFNFVGGLIALGWFGVEMRARYMNLTETATAEVVSVRASRGSRSTHFCPTFRWNAADKTIVTESDYCTNDSDQYVVGEKVDVRYGSRGDEVSVRPSGFWPMYGEAFVVAGGGLFLWALGIFTWRMRRRRMRDEA